MKNSAGAKSESGIGKEEKQIRCFGYIDKIGRLLVPLRNRREAGIADAKGVDVEAVITIKKVYK